jgi:hypothetical protein
MLRSLSLDAAALYERRAVQEALGSTAEADAALRAQDAAIRAQKCGRVCDDLSGFADLLDARLEETAK